MKHLVIYLLVILNVSSVIAETYQYRLSSGDKISVIVLEQPDLSGEYLLDGLGKFTMPFVGSMAAEGLTIQELEAAITNKLRPDYLINPRVNIKILNYRPYYILGEVNSPGSYAYVEGITYLNAVAIAGGFTYRAKKSHVLVTRESDSEKKERRVRMNEFVQPGDIIKIEERFF